MAWSELVLPLTGTMLQSPSVQPGSAQIPQPGPLPRPGAGSEPGPGPNREPAPVISVLVGLGTGVALALDGAPGVGEDTRMLVGVPAWFLPSSNPASKAR